MTRTLAFAAAMLGVAHAALAQDFRPVVDQLARGWQRGDVSMLGSNAASIGVSLDVEGRIGLLPGRQAASALRRLFDQRETLSVAVSMSKEVDGSPRRALAELTWINRERGTTIPERWTIFVALELEREQWRITEIRRMK